MEVVDPFVPSFQPENSGFGEIPQEWATPFMPGETAESENSATAVEAPAEDVAPVSTETVFTTETDEPGFAPVSVEVVPTPAPAHVEPFDGDGGSVAEAKNLAARLADTLGDLHRTLDQSTEERNGFLRERAEMQARIHSLEAEAARKEEFKALLQTGMGATLSAEDLATLQSMTDALTQDPDRLTLLFNVVQQAPKLATAVTVFTQLRRLAEQS
jgi:hypothetical protein